MSRVLLIGWEAADWRLLRPLMDRGLMPHLQAMVRTGVSGDLAIPLPWVTSSFWTSVATGKRAHQHGILQPCPRPGHGGNPVVSRQCAALWDILGRSGFSSVVVGWPATDPVEPIRGAMISDAFIRRGIPGDPGSTPDGVHPSRLLGSVSDLRISPDRIGPELLRALLPMDPALASAPPVFFDRIHRGAVELSTVHAVATALVQWEPWDFIAVRYSGLLPFGCAGLDSDLQGGIGPLENTVLLSHSLACLDRMLGTLIHLVGPETRILVVAGGVRRPDQFQFLPWLDGFPAAQVSLRERGAFAMSGPGIRMGSTAVGTSILDITPTILQAFGLPMGEDMDGSVMPVFSQRKRLASVPGWDPPRTGSVAKADPSRVDPVASLLSVTGADERFHLACGLMDCGRVSDAALCLENLWNERPADFRSALLLLRCRLLLREHGQARQTFEELLRRLRFGPSGETAVERSTELEGGLDQNALWFLEAELLEREDRLGLAMRMYRQLMTTAPLQSRRDLHLRLAEGHLRLGERAAAINQFATACSIDTSHVPSINGLSRAYILARHFQEAVAEARRAVELDPANPVAHFLQGVALVRCGYPDWAASSLEEAVRQNPMFPQAHRRLARIYRVHLNNPAKARQHLRSFLKTRPPGSMTLPMRSRSRTDRIQGRIAKARTGNPSPLSGLGQATTISEPVAGT
ncbi:MAG: tetratricopeptide repeat protein [Verrucomicrobia bacterium]|nr:tetratricopeptide repeat protein [Verrucomicrobiota bacterium]